MDPEDEATWAGIVPQSPWEQLDQLTAVAPPYSRPLVVGLPPAVKSAYYGVTCGCARFDPVLHSKTATLVCQSCGFSTWHQEANDRYYTTATGHREVSDWEGYERTSGPATKVSVYSRKYYIDIILDSLEGKVMVMTDRAREVWKTIQKYHPRRPYSVWMIQQTFRKAHLLHYYNRAYPLFYMLEGKQTPFRWTQTQRWSLQKILTLFGETLDRMRKYKEIARTRNIDMHFILYKVFEAWGRTDYMKELLLFLPSKKIKQRIAEIYEQVVRYIKEKQGFGSFPPTEWSGPWIHSGPVKKRKRCSDPRLPSRVGGLIEVAPPSNSNSNSNLGRTKLEVIRLRNAALSQSSFMMRGQSHSREVPGSMIAHLLLPLGRTESRDLCDRHPWVPRVHTYVRGKGWVWNKDNYLFDFY